MAELNLMVTRVKGGGSPGVSKLCVKDQMVNIFVAL